MRRISSTSTSTHQSSPALRMPTMPSNSLPVSSASAIAASPAALGPFIRRCAPSSRLSGCGSVAGASPSGRRGRLRTGRLAARGALSPSRSRSRSRSRSGSRGRRAGLRLSGRRSSSAVLSLSATAPPLLGLHEPVDELVLPRGGGRVVDLAVLTEPVELLELPPDGGRVVVDLLRLLEDLLGNGRQPA